MFGWVVKVKDWMLVWVYIIEIWLDNLRWVDMLFMKDFEFILFFG